jgi:hypothetical protein
MAALPLQSDPFRTCIEGLETIYNQVHGIDKK